MRITQSLLSWRSFHGKNIQSPLRSLAWAFLPAAAAILTLLLATGSSSFAGSASWLANPVSGDWNTAGNWNAGGPPNGPADTATFAFSSITGVSLSANTEVNGIKFNAGASAFTITASPTFALTISGVGITNNSMITQKFVAAGDSGGGVGTINFTNSATAGLLTVFTNNGGAVSGAFGGSTQFFGTSTATNGIFTSNGGTISGAFGGVTQFNDTSTAGNGTLTANGGAVSGAFGGGTQFFDTATAGNATLIANGGTGGGAGGTIQFAADSTGGTAPVKVFGNGNLDISGHNAPGVTIGSIEGKGFVFLGAINLTVGSNNLGTNFSGVIQDGGVNGGTGGSLTKTGTGKLNFTGVNTYTGGTTIEGGRLSVSNTSGSGTGSGAVVVNAGVLTGRGIIAGTVTVGTGTSPGAFLLPGKGESKPGTLTINSALTFNSLSTYKCVLNRGAPKASQVSALGVTINSNASFTFLDTGTGTLTTGTVFNVVNNTSTSPITGTFSNLADGAVFASNGNNFQASYTGGTGNDLTLTVVP